MFRDETQAYDKDWHEGLKKLKYVSETVCRIFSPGHFDRILGLNWKKLIQIKASVLPGNALGTILYLLYTRDIPLQKITMVARFS